MRLLRLLAGSAPTWCALCACAVGGVAFYLLRTPLPWMIGPLVTMAGLKFFGFSVAAPRFGRAAGQIVVGCTLGLYFTPQVGREVLAYWDLLLFAALFAVGLAYVGAWMLTRWTDTDRTTALFASVPGGAAEMANLGDRFGARPERIAVAQSVRIMLVVVIVPFAITWSGAHGVEGHVGTVVASSWSGLIALLGCATIGGFALWFIGSPNPFMLGPLGVVLGLTLAEIHWSAVPNTLVNASQLLIGCSLGSRFERAFMRAAPRFVVVVVVTSVAGILVSGLFGAAVAYWGGIPIATMVLATAPGGIAEMCITAQALQLGVPLVTAAHVTRLIILVTTTAPIFRLMRGFIRRQ